MQRPFLLSLIAFASLILGAPTNDELPSLRPRQSNDGIVWYLIANSVASSCGSGTENVITDVSGSMVLSGDCMNLATPAAVMIAELDVPGITMEFYIGAGCTDPFPMDIRNGPGGEGNRICEIPPSGQSWGSWRAYNNGAT